MPDQQARTHAAAQGPEDTARGAGHLRAAQRTLKEVFGYTTFRPGQEEVVEALLAGRDALALMPTGGGKSICYQVPSILREGTGIVISPLIALMTDQVAALRQAGVSAEAIHSGLPAAKNRSTLARLTDGSLDILYVAPERAQSTAFQERLGNAQIALVAIDEAHCVDKWGHDFRDDYLGLHRLRAFTGDAPWFACTATADHRSLEVIKEQLRLERAAVFQGSYDRPNIHYSVVDRPARAEELAQWVAEEHAGEAGIVYCRSRRRTEELAEQLRGHGLHALAYHAGLPGLIRRTLEDRFRSEPGLVVCATVAFGMGIDRSDVRFVVHAEPPDSMDAYVQETGRAGRDGLPASARLHVDGRTIAQTARSLEAEFGPEARTKQNRFRAFLGYLEATTCRRQVLLGFFGQAYPQACGLCDNCDAPSDTWDAQEAAGLVLDAVVQTGQRFGSSHVIDVLLGRATAKVGMQGHASLAVFGAGAPFSEAHLRAVCRHLVARGALRSDRHGGLSVAHDGIRGQPLLLRHPVERPQKPRRAARARPSPGDCDPRLWSLLRTRRRELAQEQGVPAFVVFHDSSLLEMAVRRPTTEAEFLAVPGVGKAKLERYGEAFMGVVREHAALPARA